MRRQSLLLITCLLLGLLLQPTATPVQAQSSGTAGTVAPQGCRHLRG